MALLANSAPFSTVRLTTPTPVVMPAATVVPQLAEIVSSFVLTVVVSLVTLSTGWSVVVCVVVTSSTSDNSFNSARELSI